MNFILVKHFLVVAANRIGAEYHCGSDTSLTKPYGQSCTPVCNFIILHLYTSEAPTSILLIRETFITSRHEYFNA